METCTGQIIIIHGGELRIGFQQQNLIENGAKVSIFGLYPGRVGDYASSSRKGTHPIVLGFAPDLTSRDAAAAAVERLHRNTVMIDVMTNNAGIDDGHRILHRVSEEDFKHIRNITLLRFHGAWSALPAAKRGKAGVIITRLLLPESGVILIRNRLSYQQGRRDQPDSCLGRDIRKNTVWLVV